MTSNTILTEVVSHRKRAFQWVVACLGCLYALQMVFLYDFNETDVQNGRVLSAQQDGTLTSVLVSETMGGDAATPMSQRTIEFDMTWLRECRERKLYNETWGATVAPFVDKVGTKELIAQWGTLVKTVPNVAVYTRENISSFTPEVLANFPDSIFKPGQGMGHTARIYNNTYNCFKACKGPEDRHSLSWKENDGDLEKAHKAIAATIKHLLYRFPTQTFMEREPQYKFTPPRVLIEQRLPVESMKEYHWWVVRGHPVFVCIRCDDGAEKRGSYYSTAFNELEMGNFEHNCTGLAKPKTWDKMLTIVKQLGAHIDEIVSIDLYANDEDVYFSEFTFTRNLCKTHSTPKIADSLLYFIDHEMIHTSQVTASFVEQTIADRSWVHVALDSKEAADSGAKMLATTKYPSSLDLCKALNGTKPKMSHCLGTVDPIKTFPLHCVSTKGGRLLATGIWKNNRAARVFVKIDWMLATGLLVLWAACKITAKGTQQRHQVWNCILYLTVVVIYKWHLDINEGLLAPTSLWTTVTESWYAFTVVHPTSSPAIALSHFGTYWVSVAAFRSRCLQSMLLYWCCYEVATSFINEYFHLGEEDDGIHCARATFIASAKHYAVNDVIRVYLMPPLLVYGYLVPKMLLHWLGLL